MPPVKVHNPITGTMKTLAVVAVIGLLVYDGVQIGLKHVNAQDTANESAHAGEDVVFDNPAIAHSPVGLAQACAAAQAYAKGKGSSIVGYKAENGLMESAGTCVINPDSTIDLKITATAQQVVIGRFDKSLINFQVKGHADKEG